MTQLSANSPQLEPQFEPDLEPQIQHIGWLSLPAMRYPNEYLWMVLASTLDITMTWVILSLEGFEVNPVADVVIKAWGLPGAIMFKFSLMMFVIIVCEVVGRERDHVGRNLSQVSVVVNMIPVLWSLVLLAVHALDSAV